MKYLVALLILIPLVGCGAGSGDEPPAVKPGTDTPTAAGDQALNENAARARAQGEAHQSGQ